MIEHIAVTGAAGFAAKLLRPRLLGRGYQLMLVDVVDTQPAPGERFVRCDLTDSDALRASLSGVDAVVHLGGLSRENDFAELLRANVLGTQILLEAAVDTEVTAVLLASSTHAIGNWPVPTNRTSTIPYRPDSFYGLTKVAVEQLGQMYAQRFGLSVTAARLGAVTEYPESTRALGMWLSPEDLTRLAIAASERKDGQYRCVWGVSRNTRSWFDLSGGEQIDYHPVDDAEAFASDVAVDDHPLIGSVWNERPWGQTWHLN